MTTPRDPSPYDPEPMRRAKEVMAQRRAARAESVASIVVDDDAIDTLRRNSSPVPGRDGVRIDGDGRVWYSARWLGMKS